MIGIIRNNFQEAKVDELVLDNLIDSNKIIAFSRSNVWVVVGRDAVRERRTYYAGEERRRVIYGENFCMR